MFVHILILMRFQGGSSCKGVCISISSKEIISLEHTFLESQHCYKGWQFLRFCHLHAWGRGRIVEVRGSRGVRQVARVASQYIRKIYISFTWHVCLLNVNIAIEVDSFSSFVFLSLWIQQEVCFTVDCGDNFRKFRRAETSLKLQESLRLNIFERD